MKKSVTRDIEKVYTKSELVKKLRRFVDALEADKKFSIQIANERTRKRKKWRGNWISNKVEALNYE